MRSVLVFFIPLLLMAQAEAQHIRPDLEPMPTDIGPTYVEIDGQVYGARPSEFGPIGGGGGYQRIITRGDRNVSNIDELRDALHEAKAGEVVYLDPAGDYDCTALVFAEELVIEIPAGVTLASDRGHEGSRGAVIYSDAHATSPLIRALGSGVRVTGLWIRGPTPGWHIEHHRRSFTRNADGGFAYHDGEGPRGGHPYYYRFPSSTGIMTRSDDLEVDNCEISGWTRGIWLRESHGHHIHHNYIHHCQFHGLGYGVAHATASSLIEYNLFDANRHSIAASGHPGEGYEARHNVELHVARSFPFDMHGGRDRRDGTDIAGTWLRIHNNQFRATDQRAIGIRGRPEERSFVHNNWFYHGAPGPGIMMPWPAGGDTNISFENNAYGREDPKVE
jgi:hypothetical protein